MVNVTRDKSTRRLRASDIRGLAQLATRATLGVSAIAEDVNHSIWNTMGASQRRVPRLALGITRLVFKSVNGTTKLVGSGVDNALSSLEPLIDSDEDTRSESPRRASLVAVLNGVMGDQLLATGNPLATPMTLRCHGKVLDLHGGRPLKNATGKVLLLIHGLCRNDLHWNSLHQGRLTGHGEVLGSSLGYTPVYLRYNSGLHTSHNGRELSGLMQELVTHWPVPIEELTVLAHSMGGLIARSAIHYARQEALSWPKQVKNIVFLGTPHHGAPLERAGQWIDSVLGSTPYSAPFTALGRLRSAGITDLRYGFVLEQDWQDHNRFKHKPDQRQVLPLPQGIANYTVAATTASKRGVLANRLVGDRLVPLNSAIGHHSDPQRTLAFEQSSIKIAYRTKHLALLRSPEVTRQLLQWLSPV